MLDALAEHGFLVFVVVAVVAGAAGTIFHSWSHGRIVANLQKLATQLGLEFLPNSDDWGKPPRVVGTLRGKKSKFSIIRWIPEDQKRVGQR